MQSTGDRAGRLTSGASELQVAHFIFCGNKIQSVMMHLRTNEKKTDIDRINKMKGTNRVGGLLLHENGLIVELQIQVA